MTSLVHRIGIKPELLAPAGSVEAFFAAIENGADAVYAGLHDFSARSRARNFTPDDLSRMASLCRREGRRLYVTLNTLLKEHELPKIVEILSMLADAGVDAVIVQDQGLARIARAHFPSLALHASTQMTVHTLSGVRQLATLGFRRVVLARELTLPEIRAIAAESPIEIETFVHGALCFCISGQCLFSSFLGGRSGNRGDCAQPCRRSYRFDGAGEYPFSTRDLWGIEAVRSLADAGVASIKIEGRMKPAGYVAASVSAYRRLIDAPFDRYDAAVSDARSLLTGARGRTGTSGFLVEGKPDDLTDPVREGAVGEEIGRVEAVGREGIRFVTTQRLHAGDRLRVQPATGREGRTFTVRRIETKGGGGTVAQPGTQVAISAPFRFAIGDTVYKVADGASGMASEAACLRRLAAVPSDRISCNLALSLQGETLSILGTTDDFSFGKEFAVGTLAAARDGNGSEALRARFAETGGTPFALSGFEASQLGDRFIPPSRIKEIRRSFYAAFGSEATDRHARNRKEVDEAARNAFRTTPRAATGAPSELWVGVGAIEDIASLDPSGVAGFLVPIGRGVLREDLDSASDRIDPDRNRIVWRLPFWLAGEDTAAVAEMIDRLIGRGFRHFEANNPAHFPLLQGRDVRILAGWRLGAMNSAALRALHDQGASAAVLSPEDDGENLALLLGADLPIVPWVTLAGRPALMVSRIPVSRSAGDDGVSIEPGGGGRLSTEDGLTVLRPGVPFSVTGYRDRLRAAGCRGFVAELAGVPTGEREPMLRAAREGEPVPGASSFNFERKAGG
jgi:putative protease